MYPSRVWGRNYVKAMKIMVAPRRIGPALSTLVLGTVLLSCGQPVGMSQVYRSFSSGYASLTGSSGTSSSSFAYPRGIAVDAAGNIFVVDSANSRIVETSGISSSTWTAKFPTDATPTGDSLFAPEGIAVDQVGDVWVADSGNGRVVHLNTADWQSATPTFDYCDSVTDTATGRSFALSLPSGLAVTGPAVTGRFLYLTDPGTDFPHNSSMVFKIDAGAPFPANHVAVGLSFLQSGGSNSLSWPRGIAVNPGGTKVYVADEAAHRIVMLDASLGGWTALGGSPGSGTGQFISPQTLAVDSMENIYVVDSANYWVVKMADITAAGWAKIGKQGGSSYNSVYPAWVAVDSSFHVFVSDDVADQIVEFQ